MILVSGADASKSNIFYICNKKDIITSCIYNISQANVHNITVACTYSITVYFALPFKILESILG